MGGQRRHLQVFHPKRIWNLQGKGHSFSCYSSEKTRDSDYWNGFSHYESGNNASLKYSACMQTRGFFVHMQHIFIFSGDSMYWQSSWEKAIFAVFSMILILIFNVWVVKKASKVEVEENCLDNVFEEPCTIRLWCRMKNQAVLCDS